MLCLLKNFEIAKEVPRHLEILNKKVMHDLTHTIKNQLSNNWHIIEDNFNETGCFAFCKSNWVQKDTEDWLICFSFETEYDLDDFDYWVSHLTGFSKDPFSIYCSFNGLLSNGTDKETLKGKVNTVTDKLKTYGFSEVPSKSKKNFYFSKPITFELNSLISEYEGDAPENAFQSINLLIQELENLVPFIDEALEQFK